MTEPVLSCTERYWASSGQSTVFIRPSAGGWTCDQPATADMGQHFISTIFQTVPHPVSLDRACWFLFPVDSWSTINIYCDVACIWMHKLLQGRFSLVFKFLIKNVTLKQTFLGSYKYGSKEKKTQPRIHKKVVFLSSVTILVV